MKEFKILPNPSTPESLTTLLDYLMGACRDHLATEDGSWLVSHYNGAYDDAYTFTEASDALRTGKTCTRYSVYFGYDREFNAKYNELMCNLFNELIEAKNIGTIAELVEALEQVPQIKFYKSEEKSKDVYNPVNKKFLKPLKELPKKWTNRHLIRLLANDQFEDLITNYLYTDDYAYDAAVNNHEGRKVDGDAMLQDVLSISMNRVYANKTHDDGSETINFGAHMNESYSLKTKI